MKAISSKIGLFAVIAAVIGALAFGAVLVSPQESHAAVGYGKVGYSCVKNNTSTGKLVVGDSRCCQLWDYKKTGASFTALWGGHYGPIWKTSTNRIDYSTRLNSMKTYIKDSLKKKGFCKVYVFATVNDFNNGKNFNTYANYCIDLAKTLKNVSYNGKKPTVTVMSMVPPKGKSASSYNTYLKSKASSAKLQWKSINSCLGGSNSGYSGDGLHYNNTTLKNIWKVLS